MPINPISTTAKLSHTLGNPNSALSTAIIEIPTDLGRSYAGYKRGGIIEGSEKLRKELMSAGVWLFGIPLIKKAGDTFCEKILNIPMGIAFSNSKQGNSAIENSIKYLTSNGKEILGDFKNTENLQKYFKNGVSKFNGQNAEQLIKKVKGAKIATSIAAVTINCILMGFALPLINQKITQKKLKNLKQENQNKAQNQNLSLKVDSLDEFKKKTQKTSVPFKGNLMNYAETFVDLVENSTKFRLIAPDVPMIAGRMATSRNKYEALEYLLMDGSGIFLYNFCSPLVQKGLKNLTHTVDIDAKAAEIIANCDENLLKNAIQKLNGKDLTINDLFNESIAENIYKECTNGDWGHIEKYIKNSTKKDIDKSVVNLLEAIKSKAVSFDENKKITLDINKAKDLIKKTNQKSLAFQVLGWATAVFGLAYAVPKIAYWITSKLTGKNEFAGLADYDDEKK